MIGNTLVNHIMYADDLVVLSPCSAGPQQFLSICSVYGVEYDIRYNASESAVMICRTKEDKCLKFPDFNLADNNLGVCNTVKYLGHFITE